MSETHLKRKCVKCEIGYMTGPTFKSKDHGHTEDRLQWICSTCGYVEYTPTADAKK
jgi:hypothetical protein